MFGLGFIGPFCHFCGVTSNHRTSREIGIHLILVGIKGSYCLGMNYSLITEEMIVGSQPQKVEDVDHLKEEENVAYILNLQQDKDIEYWGIDLPSIIKSCQRAGIRHMRRPARDFDPESLRFGLPKAVSSLDWAISEGKGRVYVHCTAGLGRAPAVAIAYMFWFCDMDLNTAYSILTSKRPCGPNKKALRGATYDLAKNDPWKEPFENLPEHAFKDVADWERKQIQVEGLMMDIVAAQEEIIRWKVVAQQEADVGKIVEPDFVAQLLAVRQELEEAKQAVVEFRINLNSKKKQQMLPWQQVNH